MQARSVETRNKIIGAAQDLFSRSGFESASVSDICRVAGISKGAFYHHFPSKQAVFLELLDEWLKGIDAGLEAMRGNRSEALESLIRMADILPVIIRASQGKLPIFLEFWVHAARDEALWQAAIAPYRRYREYIKQILAPVETADGAQEADMDTAAAAVISLAIGLLLQGIVDPASADWGAVGRDSLRMLLTGMTQPAAPVPADSPVGPGQPAQAIRQG
jgi:AcrR family transcriptional regulator